MILDNGVIQYAIEFAFGRICVRIYKKFQLSIILATWCMVLDNRVIKYALLVVFISITI